MNSINEYFTKIFSLYNNMYLKHSLRRITIFHNEKLLLYNTNVRLWFGLQLLYTYAFLFYVSAWIIFYLFFLTFLLFIHSFKVCHKVDHIICKKVFFVTEKMQHCCFLSLSLWAQQLIQKDRDISYQVERKVFPFSLLE